MVLKILLIAAILVQLVATVFALRLVRTTKYNSIRILFIIGFFLLSVVHILHLCYIWYGYQPGSWILYLGVVISVCLSIGVMYAYKLFQYIDRLDRERQLWNRRIQSAVLRTEERERSHFARELHDGLGPLLSSAKLSLSALSADETDSSQRELMHNTSSVIDEAIRSLREISNNLSPHVLNDFGLVRGVRHFIGKSVAIRDVSLRFSTNLQDERFETDVEVILYRVICELINNSLKHAACRTIRLALTQQSGELALDYRDDGCGFDPAAVRECGMGLSNIASRVTSLNGSFHLVSSRGSGMQAAIRIPVPEEPARRHKKRS